MYITTEQIENYLNIDLEDNGVTLAEMIIEGVSSLAETYCNGTWIEIDEEEEEIDVMPDGVRLALTQWAARIFREAQDAGKVAEQVQVGPMNIKYKLSKEDIPEFVKRVLDMQTVYSF